MKIAISGHRDLHDYDLDVINGRIMQNMRDPDLEEMFFGGAIGTDSHALRFAYLARGAQRKSPILTVVCPNTKAHLPQLARSWAEKYADRFVELGLPITGADGWWAFKARNHWMVDQIRDCGQLDAFWSGRQSGGTYEAITYAITTGACWEHILIRSQEPPT